MNEILEKRERVKWYIRAHGHSLSGAYKAIGRQIIERNLTDLTAALIEVHDGLLRELDFLEEAMNIVSAPRNLELGIDFVAQKIAISDLKPTDKQVLEELLGGARDNLGRIGRIIQNPDYEDAIVVDNLAMDAFFDVTRAHRDKFPGLIPDSPIKLKSGSNITEYPPMHTCSPYDMYLLFYNLLNNAVEAIDKGRIRIRTVHYPDKNYARWILQTPTTISEENLERMKHREPFTTKAQGSGQGMGIIYHILDKYKGTLRISSNPAKQITRFEFDIPYRR